MRSLVLILIAAALAGCGGPAARYAVHEVPVDAARAAAIVSAYRTAHGLGPVVVDGRLNRVAAAQAKGNAEIGELSHDVGGSFPIRLASFGAADRAHAAENLAAGSATLDATVGQWKASREHNKNLLMRDAAHIGIARFDAPGARMKHFWTLVLAQ